MTCPENILSYWYLVRVFTVIILIKVFIVKRSILIYVYVLTRGIIKQGYTTCKHVHEQPTGYPILCVLFDIHLAVVYRCTRQLSSMDYN